MPDITKRPGNVLWLCLLLAAGAAAFTAFGIWLLFSGVLRTGVLALIIGVLMAAAALGLYGQKRWGVVIFGLLAVLGSINHLVNVVARYPAEALQQPGAVAAAAVSILFAILIPAALFYLTLLLWRQSK